MKQPIIECWDGEGRIHCTVCFNLFIPPKDPDARFAEICSECRAAMETGARFVAPAAGEHQ